MNRRALSFVGCFALDFEVFHKSRSMMLSQWMLMLRLLTCFFSVFFIVLLNPRSKSAFMFHQCDMNFFIRRAIVVKVCLKSLFWLTKLIPAGTKLRMS